MYIYIRLVYTGIETDIPDPRYGRGQRGEKNLPNHSCLGCGKKRLYKQISGGTTRSGNCSLVTRRDFTTLYIYKLLDEPTYGLVVCCWPFTTAI